MKRSALRHPLLASAAIAAAPAALAGTDTWFTPLTQSAPVVAPNDLAELSSPWVAPEGLGQKNIVSLREVEDKVLSPEQSGAGQKSGGGPGGLFLFGLDNV